MFPSAAGSGDPALQLNKSSFVAGLGAAGTIFAEVLVASPGSATPATLLLPLPAFGPLAAKDLLMVQEPPHC
jgi:hypothetical protein